MDKPKIRFIDVSYKTLFFVEDGEDIEIEIENGWMRCTCHYIDEYHFKLDNQLYSTYEFALLRDRIGNRCRPVQTQTENEADHDNV
jgi:hypothetical protein